MARPARRSALLGWLGTAFGLALLAAIGFALGLVAGGLWEEPDLVLRHLVGGSEEVAWGPEQTLLAGAADEAPTAVSAPPPAGGSLAVQVGAFRDSRAAERLADTLRAKGYAVYLSPGAAAGDARWRVRVGPLGTREEAERAAGRLKREERLPTWVLDEDEG